MIADAILKSARIGMIGGAKVKRRYRREEILRLVYFPAMARAAVAFALLGYFSFPCRAVTCTSFGSPITADQAASDLLCGTSYLELKVMSKGGATRTYKFTSTHSTDGYQVSENGGPSSLESENDAASLARYAHSVATSSGVVAMSV